MTKLLSRKNMNTDISFYCDYDAIKVIYSTERDKERKEKNNKTEK